MLLACSFTAFAQNVGIGVATPQNKVDVEGAAVVGASYSGTNVAPANGMLIEGSVGIGTPSPSYKLHVRGTANTAVITADAPITASGQVIKLAFLNTPLTQFNVQLQATAEDFPVTSAGLGFLTTSSSATTEKMYITGSGRVGIGTNIPTAYLQTWAGSTGATPHFHLQNTSYTNLMYVDNNGWVGFGTSSPVGSFTIRPGISGVWPGGPHDGVRIIHPNQTNTIGDGFLIGMDVTTGTEAVLWNFEDDDMIFAIANSEKMRLEQTTGDLGIGTSAPQNILHLHEMNAINNPEGLRITTATTGATSFDGLFIGLDIAGSVGRVWHHEYAPLIFGTDNQERMRVSPGGFVGIGTSSPSAYLHIHDVSGIYPSVKLTTASLSNGAELVMNFTGDVTLRTNESGQDVILQTGSSTLTLQGSNNLVASMSGEFDVNGTFKVAATGDITEIKNVPYSWPAANASGVLTNNGTGTLSWAAAGGGGTLDYAYDFGGAGAGRTIIADAGAVSIQGADGLEVTGTFGIGASIGSPGAGTRMIFNPKRAAFRAGHAAAAQWDDASTGDYSVAMGYSTTASGDYSTALGYYSQATGDHATAMGFSTIASATVSTALGYSTDATGNYSTATGFNSTASGQYSTAMGATSTASGLISTAIGALAAATGDYATAFGENTTAESGYETTLGRWNTDYVPISTTGWNTSDRLFVVGNGTASGSRSDAMVILKNGNTGIGQSSPTARLEVSATASTNTILRSPIAATGDMTKLVFLHTSGSSVMNAQVAGVSDDFAASSSGLAFLTTSSSSTTEKMRISGSGKVGIGTTTPAFPLQLMAADGNRNADVQNTNAAGDGIWASNTAAAGTGNGAGVVGLTNQASGLAAGVYGQNAHTNGTGITGSGNNQSTFTLAAGSGAAFTGNTTGVYTYSTNAALGEGLYAQQFGDVVRVAYYNGTLYKINGAGTVSTIVQDTNANWVTMFASESPEVLLTDYGQGRLAGGFAHIELDPTLAMNVTISEEHPLRVFIQLEGDCNGVYVTNKTATGFDVVELNGGTSNTPFQYQVVCNRADQVLPSGRISEFDDLRFPVSQEPAQAVEPSSRLDHP